MKIGNYTFLEWQHHIKEYHGHLAPGLVLGGMMIEALRPRLRPDSFYDVYCETTSCLPDAVQMLTPCTIGNGWLKVLDYGRFALCFYDKYSGLGWRISLDMEELRSYKDIYEWFLKLKPKREQSMDLLLEQMEEGGFALFKVEEILLPPEKLKKESSGKTAICPLCGESYPLKHGSICRACDEGVPYTDREGKVLTGQPLRAGEDASLSLNGTAVEDAVGAHLLHDLTKIDEGFKGRAFKKGDLINASDIEEYRKIGKYTVYTTEANPEVENRIHEDEASVRFAYALAGDGVKQAGAPSEGKINLYAGRDGLLVVDEESLIRFNSSGLAIVATCTNYKLVKKGELIGGTRLIPLYISNDDLVRHVARLGSEHPLKVIPLRKAKVGIITTGRELYDGIIKDSYAPLLKAQLETFDAEVIGMKTAPDDPALIAAGISGMIDRGADLVIATGGMSVDPDDCTLEGIRMAGAHDIVYGMPLLSGSMLAVARIGSVQIVGTPAAGVGGRSYGIDRLLPLLLAGVTIDRKLVATFGTGGLLSCTGPREKE